MNRAFKISLVIFAMWLGMTCLIDFLAVPAGFHNISSRQEAGTLGMIIFTTFNKVEMVFSLIALVCAYFYCHLIKRKKLYFGVLALVVMISCLHTFYMAPKIVELNQKKWQLSEDAPEYQVLEKEHLFFHSTFRKTDGTKIFLLLFLIGGIILKREEESEDKGEKV